MFATDRSHTNFKATVHVGSVIEAGITECRSQVRSTFATLLGCWGSGFRLIGWIFDTVFVVYFNKSSQNAYKYLSQGWTMTIASWHVLSNLWFTNSSQRSLNYRLCLRISKKHFLELCCVFYIVTLLSCSLLAHLSWTCWVVPATVEGSKKKTFRFPRS
jgi:hypothetical protein